MEGKIAVQREEDSEDRSSSVKTLETGLFNVMRVHNSACSSNRLLIMLAVLEDPLGAEMINWETESAQGFDRSNENDSFSPFSHCSSIVTSISLFSSFKMYLSIFSSLTGSLKKGLSVGNEEK